MRHSHATLIAIVIIILVCYPSAYGNPYDVKHYELSISPDFKTKIVSLSATIRIENKALESSFSFELNKRYQHINVYSPDSRVVVSRDGGIVTATIEKPSAKVTLIFDLKGELGSSLDEDRNVIDEHSLFLLWSDRFYPITFSDWATVQTNLTLPVGFQVLAPGREVQVQRRGDKMLHTFESTVPEINFSVLADRRWIKTEKKIGAIKMKTLLHPESQKFASQVLSTSGEVLKFYSDIFCPYPFQQFSFVTIRGMYARRAFSDSIGYEPNWLEKEFTKTGYDAHETSLLWWGHTIRGTGRGSSQWLEGFGDYAEVLYSERYQKPLPRNFSFFKNKYLTSFSAKDLLYSELRGNVDQALIHGKYPWLMHLIRFVVGDKKFSYAMKQLFKNYKFRALTMEEFISSLEQGTGESLDWFTEEWLQRRGVPSISLRSGIREEAGSYKLTCTLEQIGNIYHLPIEIGIETVKGMRLVKIYLSKQQESVSFVSKDKPQKILLDPHDWILMVKPP